MINGTSIKLHSGKYFDFSNPTEDMIDIHDIMHNLSKEQRFGNCLENTWSVLQHVLLVSHIVKLEGGSKEEQYQALHHDDTETYFLDIPTPLKKMLPKYNLLYGIAEEIIYRKFEITDIDMYPIVKEADKKAMLIEDTIFGVTDSDWHEYDIEQYNDESDELKEKVKELYHMLPAKLKQEYLKQHKLLCPTKQLIS